MTLTKIPPIDKVKEQYRAYISAILTPSLRDTHRATNLKAIYTSIVLATEYNKTGSAEDGKVNEFLTENLYQELVVKFPYVRHGEITLALKKGVLGEFKDKFPKDKFIAINVATLYQFVKFYLESDERKKALEEWNKVLDEENGIVRTDTPVTKIFEVSKEQILSYYNDYLRDGDVTTYARIYYDAIVKIKGQILTKAEKIEIANKAVTWYENDLKRKKTTKDMFASLMASFDKESRTFESVAKRLSLKKYFDDCKQNNTLPV